MREKLRKVRLALLAIPKTIIFNLYYFPFRTAIHFPIIVSHRVCLRKMGGKVIIPDNISFGMIRIGFHENRIYDNDRERAVWFNQGTIIFHGTAYIGAGSRISCSGKLSFGNGFSISGNSAIECLYDICFGENVLISYGCVFIDGDSHKVVLIEEDSVVNCNKQIHIGDHVWIGAFCMIMKGSYIDNDSVVGAKSVVMSHFEPNVCIGGYPAKIIKRNINWKM